VPSSKEKKVDWPEYYRIISSRYPPIDLFERVAPPEDWDILAEIETLTNPRVREQIGEISSIPVSRRVTGNGASYVLAPLVHFSPSRPSRFSDGTSYGVFYAAKELETAIHEIAYHLSKFYAATEEEGLKVDQRILKGKINSSLHNITGDGWDKEHNPNDYKAAQALARKLRDDESNGVLYNSVRKAGGVNFAAFWPDVMSIPVQTNHIQFNWNGQYINKYFVLTKKNSKWTELPNLLNAA
jgi:hypothetical protein